MLIRVTPCASIRIVVMMPVYHKDIYSQYIYYVAPRAEAVCDTAVDRLQSLQELEGPMPERRRSFLVPCIAAAASVGTALLLTLRIPPPPGRPFMLLLASVAVSSRFGGRASGVLATLLSGAMIYWWLLPHFIHG